jgi:hypothetical protein
MKIELRTQSTAMNGCFKGQPGRYLRQKLRGLRLYVVPR